MTIDKPIYQSKKAVALGIALLNLNFVLLLVSFRPETPVALASTVITSILTLVGVYMGMQGGQDMITSSKLKDVVPTVPPTPTPTPTPVTMEYVTPTPGGGF